MRDWALSAGDPLYLTLAADARLSQPDYVNDHIWELELSGGEPAALSLRTSYGLRARSLRIFPRFTEKGKTVTDPAAFASPPRLRRFYPNFMLLEFQPFEGLEVTSGYWVPGSQAVAGRLALVNRTTETRALLFEICGVLVPLEGQSLTSVQMQLVHVLAGQTGGLAPVIFLTGGPAPGAGAHPSLALEVELGPGATRQLTWAQAALDAPDASFELARRAAARPWEAERARLELLNAAQTLEIYTGDLEWDAALAFSQSAALGLFHPASEHLPYPSFVIARQPDHGFSRRGDGSDYPASWSGQAPLDSCYLASLLPGAPHLAQGVLRNFLAVQTEDGTIDQRPGLGGQRGRLLAAPLLASLAWRLYQATEDRAFLSDVFPRLLSFFWAWFSAAHDRDRDGVPEWDHLLQTGFEDNPLFDVWHPWSQGVDITCLHSPALIAMLYREAQCLIQAARHLKRPGEITLLEAQAGKLQAALEACWNPRAALYAYRDRENGLSGRGKVLARLRGSSAHRLKLTFEQPVRLLLEVQTKNPATRRPQIGLAEYVTKGRAETIASGQFQWRSGGLVATSQRVYTRLGRIEVDGLESRDRLIVRSVDYTSEDHSLFLPLWASLPDRQRAQTMIGRALLDAQRFDRPYGVPACPAAPQAEAESTCLSVHLPWNQFIGEGLLAYGFRGEAARLVAHLMTAVIQNLKQKRAFYQYYHAEKGTGLGERDALTGLAPVGLFLQTLGVEIVSATKVRLEGHNPFPWPVTVKYRGLSVARHADRTEVTFPNGRTITVTDATPCTVSL